MCRVTSSLKKLRCLTTLDLTDYPNYVPDVIWTMQQLRHLYLSWKGDGNKTKLKLGNLINLQTLMNFNTNSCHLGDIFNMKNLNPSDVEDFREDEYIAMH